MAEIKLGNIKGEKGEKGDTPDLTLILSRLNALENDNVELRKMILENRLPLKGIIEK